MAEDGEDVNGADEIEGRFTEGTTVVPATLTRGSAFGVTTGFECGGGVTAGGDPDARAGATFTAEGTGVNSMGGWSPPICAISGSAGALPSGPAPGPGPVIAPVDMATPASTPTVSSATPTEMEGSGKPERTRQKVAAD